MKRSVAALVVGMVVVAAQPLAPAAADDTEITVATFNASLNRAEEGQLITDLSTPDNEQAQNVAETIQRAAPDVVLINEFDYTESGEAVDLFRDNYLEVSQNDAEAIEYPHAWTGPVNTGVPTGLDLNNDGETDTADDALGFGDFPGQYGMVIYSKYPIAQDQVRTFQNFLWADMPDALLPVDPETSESWYSEEALEILPLSSKTHADVPVDVNGTTIHILAAHPTPPSFDGAEQRNKKRNHDEIRLWADYIEGNADYLYDDNGVTGGLTADDEFVIVGDYNSDPNDGDSWPGSAQLLLESARVNDPLPSSEGAVEADALQGDANEGHVSDPQYDTADFNDDPAPGNIRVDYVLPSADGALEVTGSGVFWPTQDDELFRLTGEFPFPTSDHRLVWVDLLVGGGEPAPLPSPTPSETPSEQPSEDPSQDPGDNDDNDDDDDDRPGLPDTGV